MVSQSSSVATNNQMVWDIAVKTALEALPFTPGHGTHEDLAELVQSNDRVASAARDFELTLVDALVPVLRDEVESGRLELSEGHDYLKLSAQLVGLLMQEWLVIDLRL